MLSIVQTVISGLIDWFFKPLDNQCSALLKGAFTSLVGSMSNDEWNVAITAANRIGWIMGFVNMALCIIAALQGAVRGSVADVAKSFAMAVLAWPLTAVCVSVMITIDGIVGGITSRILNVPLAGTAGGTTNPFGDSVVSNLIGTITKYAGTADVVIRLLIYPIALITCIAVAGMLAARDISLILLAAVAPMPLMMAGWKATRPAAAKWAQAVAGVMLSAPLSALIIMIGSGICAIAKSNPSFTDSFFPSLMGIATLFMAVFSPKLVMPAVSFIGNNVTADMQEHGRSVGPNAIKTAVSVTAGVVSAVMTGGAGAAAGAAGAASSAGSAAKGVGAALKGDWNGVGESIGDLVNSRKGGKKAGEGEDTGGGSGSGSGSPAADSPHVPDANGSGRSDAASVMDAATGRGGSPSDGGGDGPDGSPSAPSPAPSPAPEPAPAAPPAPGVPGGQGGEGGEGGNATARGGQGGRGGEGGQGGQGGNGASGSGDAGQIPVPPPRGTSVPSGPAIG